MSAHRKDTSGEGLEVILLLTPLAFVASLVAYAVWTWLS